jgi:tetratricopeptide (TPR) repeat protein
LKVFLDAVAIIGECGGKLQEKIVPLSKNMDSLLNAILARLESICNYEIANLLLVDLSFMEYGLHENDMHKLFRSENKHVVDVTWSILYCNIKPFIISFGYIKLHPVFKNFILKKNLNNEKELRIQLAKKLEKLLGEEMCYSLDIVNQYAKTNDVINLQRVLSSYRVLSFLYKNERDLLFESLKYVRHRNLIKQLVSALYDEINRIETRKQIEMYEIVSKVFSETIPLYKIALDAVNKAIILQEETRGLDIFEQEHLLYYYLKAINIYTKLCRFQEANSLLQKYWSIVYRNIDKVQDFRFLGLKAEGDINYKCPTISQRIKAIPYYLEATSIIEKKKYPMEYVELLYHLVDLGQYENSDSLRQYIEEMNLFVESCFTQRTHSYNKAVYWAIYADWILIRKQGVSSGNLSCCLDNFLKRLLGQITVIEEMYGDGCKDLCYYYLLTATVYRNISNMYSSQNNYDEMVKNTNLSFTYFEHYYRTTISCYDKFTEEYAEALHSIAFAYQNLLESRPIEKDSIIQKCLLWYSQEEEILMELFPQGHWTLAKLYHNVADIYNEQADFETAKKYIDKALSIKRLHLNPSDISIYNSNIRKLYIYKTEMLQQDIQDEEKILEFRNQILEIHTITEEQIDLSDNEREKRILEIDKSQTWLDNWKKNVEVCRLAYAKELLEVTKKMIKDFGVRLKSNESEKQKFQSALSTQWMIFREYIAKYHLERAFDNSVDIQVMYYTHI